MRFDNARRTGLSVADGDRLKMVTAMQSGHVGAEFDLNHGIRFQPAREIECPMRLVSGEHLIFISSRCSRCRSFRQAGSGSRYHRPSS
jgi:hypothetical protein